LPSTDYPSYLYALNSCEMVYEPTTFHTYGRNTVDTACLGIPSVGSQNVFSMKHCFPEMACDPMDINKTVTIMDKVLKDKEWLQQQLDYAKQAVEYFNYDNSRERYLTALEESRKRCGK